MRLSRAGSWTRLVPEHAQVTQMKAQDLTAGDPPTDRDVHSASAPAAARDSGTEHAYRLESRQVILVLSFALAVAGFLYLTQSLRSSSPDHGDYWTDMALITAAHNLSAYGFNKLRLGVTLDNGPEVGLPPIYAPHHPSFPTVVLGIFYRLGLSTQTARLLPLLVACSGLVAIFLLVKVALGDWRIGLVALLALAASAPFRLLSDAFGYQSYDIACKLWTFLFITLAVCDTERRQRLWQALAGAGALVTIALSGFEMVPSIALYSIACPWILATSHGRQRARAAIRMATCVGSGFAVGMLLRLAHNVWLLGGVAAVIGDFLAAFHYRALSDYGGAFWGRPLSVELVHRVIAYYPIHLLVIAAGAVSAVAIRRQLPEKSLPARSCWWLLTVLLGDVAWYVVFREHTHRHVHTVYHLLLFVSASAGLAALLIWETLRSWPGVRAVALLVGLVALILAVSDVGVRPYGNVQRWVDWTWRRQQLTDLASAVPATAVVNIDTADMDPSPQFFLGRTFLSQRPTSAPSGNRQPTFLLTLSKSDYPAYADALANSRLVRQAGELALFDLRSPPGLLTGTISASPGRTLLRAWGREMWGYAIHPPAGAVGVPSTVTFPLPAGEASILTFLVTQPEYVISHTDGVGLTFTLDSPSHAGSLLAKIFLNPRTMQSVGDWSSIDVPVPTRQSPAALRVSVDCGPAENCYYDWTWIAMVSEQALR